MMTNSSSSFSKKVPEILAPVGGREQFFAALYSGADAVFLGLKQFNARSRADNFTGEDLKELLPLAHKFGMKVLVTLNILIKQSEIQALVQTLSELERLGVDAIIVQDAGVVRLAKQFFPNLRLHASTQFAVHNAAGALFASKMGFKRIVMARELTAQELRLVRQELPTESAEIESFCHGSLCYSYSGLCFFSGAADARSGNRGECAYTCRKPYKILSEPGHGFLFSMKDLNTVNDLHLLVEAGVDTFKIEGRKKDAQFVATSVGLYRNKLNSIFGRQTLRPEAPAQATVFADGSQTDDALHSFQREGTSLFLKGRYHENVIDLDNPGHKGVVVGKVEDVLSHNQIQVQLMSHIERFDGLKIAPEDVIFHAAPQHGQNAVNQVNTLETRYENRARGEFSLRDFFATDGARLATASAGSTILISIPTEVEAHKGDQVLKTRSADLKRRVDPMTGPMGNERLVPQEQFELSIKVEVCESKVRFSFDGSKFNESFVSFESAFPFQLAQKPSTLKADLVNTFHFFGEENLLPNLIVEMNDSQSELAFVPKSFLKDLKRTFGAKAKLSLEAFFNERKSKALNLISDQKGTLKNTNDVLNFAVKIDRIEAFEGLLDFAKTSVSQNDFTINEVVFEPKRAFLPKSTPLEFINLLLTHVNELSEITRAPVTLRLAMPTVIRAWDELMLGKWIKAALSVGVTRFEVGNPGAILLLQNWCLDAVIEPATLDLSSDFTLYSLNNSAVDEWFSHGISKQALSIENDWDDLKVQLQSWTSAATPQIILYKDTPLFVAESCSLTALHNGCPTAKVCGYRTLEIENDQGEKFFVAHESCKSIVYAKEAFAVSQYLTDFKNAGVCNFRVDFLTRPYSNDDILLILKNATAGKPIANTHIANHARRLL